MGVVLTINVIATFSIFGETDTVKFVIPVPQSAQTL